ncbi:acyl-CoA carboxylase subunit epsilon [Nocardioides zeae]|uniref:Acyl-CoA carboxylase subunit epsilon n=1 Tax=Nocardioides imazamoxiresistens TaxID=3231893 RepID=A0ABU3PU10_9ACTN|nr:acyl-CoA carboxylase subunit epsilon [Nocardioides zeae]MDT9592705.1 acyl-CoA carboxylase subunit epsilon [Nocardioides zeae]
MSADEAPDRPLLRIVDADATPEEVAAIVAVFSALAGGGEAPAPAPRSVWAAPGARVRRGLDHGRGAWRASGLPR